MIPLLVILPVSHADAHMLPTMGALLKKFGPYKSHRVLIAYTQDVPPADVQALRHSLEPLFSQAEAAEVRTTAKNWPMGCNQQFKAVATLAAERGMPWFNMELDVTPMQPGWLDAIATEYEANRKPFMGAVVPTRTVALQADGSLAHDTSGHHLVGWAIYPSNFARTSVKLTTVDRAMIWSGGRLEPYDLACRHEMLNHHASPHFQHNLRTVNYRQENGQIVCDNHPSNPPTASHAKPVDPRALLVHGCRDGSLQKLVLGDVKLPDPPPVATTPAPTSPAAPVAPVKVPAPSYPAVRIRKLLSDGTARRVPDVAKALEMTPEDVKAAIDSPGSALEVSGPGWVKMKNAAQPTVVV